MAISAYILKIVENDPFLRLQMRAKEMFDHHHIFSTNKQYVKIKLIQNETNLWVTSTHNKRGCAILTKNVAPKNPGTYLKLRPKNPGTRNARLPCT